MVFAFIDILTLPQLIFLAFVMFILICAVLWLDRDL
tara:strand:+ start:1063 stop:1170 length:108 start_codon:yes stop_codon:yes gene_type:complete